MAPQAKNAVLDELADPSRRAILEHLRAGPHSVSALVDLTGLKQPNVSNHLAKLKDRGIVTAQRSGRQIYYSLADPLVEAVLQTALSGASAVPQAITPGQVEQWTERFADALSRGDEQEAARVVSEALTRRLSIEDLYVDVFQHALFMLGDLYERGMVTEAEEHLGTAITDRLMARASQFYATAADNGWSALLGCVAGNWHSVGSRMIADILDHEGWKCWFLGANVPTPSFVEMAAERKPDVVIVSRMQEEFAQETRLLVEGLRSVELPKRLLIGVGGGWIRENPDFVRDIGADFTAQDVRELAPMLERLITAPR